MKKDRQNGRPIIYNNEEKQRAGTCADILGLGFRSFLCHFVTFNGKLKEFSKKMITFVAKF